jgi:hypothetical protein
MLTAPAPFLVRIRRSRRAGSATVYVMCVVGQHGTITSTVLDDHVALVQ